MGITRDEFKEYLKNLLVFENEKEKIRLILSDAQGYAMDAKSSVETYKKRIDEIFITYEGGGGKWLTTEEIELASAFDIKSKGSCPNISKEIREKIWNQKPLNQQIICLWMCDTSGEKKSRGKAILKYAFYQGGYVVFDDEGRIQSNKSSLSDVDFSALFHECLENQNIIHIYNNGSFDGRKSASHYDHLVVTSITKD